MIYFILDVGCRREGHNPSSIVIVGERGFVAKRAGAVSGAGVNDGGGAFYGGGGIRGEGHKRGDGSNPSELHLRFYLLGISLGLCFAAVKGSSTQTTAGDTLLLECLVVTTGVRVFFSGGDFYSPSS